MAPLADRRPACHLGSGPLLTSHSSSGGTVDSWLLSMGSADHAAPSLGCASWNSCQGGTGINPTW
jgi:hypothetical protein